MALTLYSSSSLEKVFPGKTPAPLTQHLSLLQEDQVSFQAVLFPDGDLHRRTEFRVQCQAADCLKVTVRRVAPVAVQLPAFAAFDDNYISMEPGLYPDRLEPLYEEDHFYAIRRTWSALWIEVRTTSDTPVGTYPVRLTIENEEESATLEVPVQVIGCSLAPQTLKHTEWFHCDGISQYYHEPVWSERYWTLLKRQIKAAAARGINMLLVPIWTPPLDTRIGSERLTTQLVDITVTQGSYQFDCTKLDRYVQICKDAGIQYFEMAHLFTQWGARHCPKIMGTKDGVYTRLFGWESDATSPEYQEFLSAFLPALRAELISLDIADRTYFHISDEPSPENLPQYQACRAMVEDLLAGFPIMDAMSSYEYFAQGICKVPVVATNHLDPFLTQTRPEEFWVYYCCGQGYQVSNRFIAMPSARNRIIGVQFYKYQVQGFLQWGFNYYNNVTSIHPIDPFATADGDGSYPAGDPFMVYPGPDGCPQESLRLVVFSDALCDLRALTTLEQLTSRAHVLALIEEGLDEELTFTTYPHDPAYLLRLREKVNQEIAAHL